MPELTGLIVAGDREEGELAQVSGGRSPHVLPIGNRPLVEYAAEAMRDCGIHRVGVLVSRGTRPDVEGALGDGRDHGLQLDYLDAGERDGLLPALATARAFVGDAPCLVHRADTLVVGSLRELAGEFARRGADALLLVRAPETGPGARRGLAAVGEPPRSSDELVSGVQFVGRRFVDAAVELLAGSGAPSLVDAADRVAQAGGAVDTRWIEGAWRCDATVDGLLSANRLVLDDLATTLDGADLAGARIEGRVSVHPTAVLERTRIRGPATVGPGAVLLDTFVGPYTAIGEDVRLEGAEIEHSIVFPGARIRYPGGRIQDSVVGHGATISRDFGLPAALRLRVGRGADVSLG